MVNAQSTSMEMVFAEASQHMWITFLFWFCVSMFLVAQAKRLGKTMLRYHRTGHYSSWPYILYSVLITSLAAIFMLTVVNAHGRWADKKLQEAREYYCRIALVSIFFE
jgi:hypothetical protein